MNRIFKYDLQQTDVQKVLLPTGAIVLKVDEQKKLVDHFDANKGIGGQSFESRLQLWALVQEGVPEEYVSVRIVGTGHPVDENDMQCYTYFDTVSMSTGLVWHILFDRDTKTVHTERKNAK